MAAYRVVWEIDIEAKSARDAAEKAREIQQDPSNIASCFTVCQDGEWEEIDLWEDENG